MKHLFLILCLMVTPFAFAQGKKVAVVKILRGEVEVLVAGKTTKLNVQDWVVDGAVVKTSDKSFVKLVFIDKSQMNVGPNSEMKIEKFSGNDSGVIDLVKGKIRSQVTKDYLQMKDKDKSKLFIKTPNAVMGVRGTDFMISTNGKNTATILFEGEVVFNKLDNRSITSSSRLEDIVDRGVKIQPGEFSVVDQKHPLPTVPAILNIQQRETLEKNDGFEESRAPSNSGNEEAKKSVVPEGLSGQIVSNDSGTINNEVAQVGGGTVEAPKTDGAAVSDPNGYVQGDKVKPTNGSFVHIESGIIIPPGGDAVLDPNTNTYIPGPETGKVAVDGSYIPPKNIEITTDGQILVAVTVNNQVKVVEVPPPTPVMTQDGGSLTTLASTVVNTSIMPTGTTTTTTNSDAPLISPNDPSNLNTSGGIKTVNDAVQQFDTGPKIRTINVKD